MTQPTDLSSALAQWPRSFLEQALGQLTDTDLRSGETEDVWISQAFETYEAEAPNLNRGDFVACGSRSDTYVYYAPELAALLRALEAFSRTRRQAAP